MGGEIKGAGNFTNAKTLGIVWGRNDQSTVRPDQLARVPVLILLRCRQSEWLGVGCSVIPIATICLPVCPKVGRNRQHISLPSIGQTPRQAKKHLSGKGGVVLSKKVSRIVNGIEIDSGVPMPSHRPSKLPNLPLADLGVGESFIVPPELAGSISARLTVAGRSLGMRFTRRRTGRVLRVWRVA